MFDEADIELQAENILITDGGRLEIGKEGAPFQHKAIITLHGHLRSPELPVYGAKTLGVREGVLDLHGMSHTGWHSRRTYCSKKLVILFWEQYKIFEGSSFNSGNKSRHDLKTDL